MSKTHHDKLAEQIAELQLRLIEVESEINNPFPPDPFSFISGARQRLIHESDVIKEKLSFLLKKKQAIEASSTSVRKKTGTKQETIYKRINSMMKHSPKATKANLFGKLAEKMSDTTEDAIRKAYYAQQSKEKKVRDAKAREKRDSEGKSDQQIQGEEKSPK